MKTILKTKTKPQTNPPNKQPNKYTTYTHQHTEKQPQDNCSLTAKLVCEKLRVLLHQLIIKHVAFAASYFDPRL